MRIERKECMRIVDTFEYRDSGLTLSAADALTVVNVLTATANISIESTISRLSTKIPRYAFIPEIKKEYFR